MPIQSFRELIVWQRSMQLARAIYQVTALLPKDELYGLTSQMRRAAVSIASNIAEGKERRTGKDFLHFLHMADGSAAELYTQLELAKTLFPPLNCSEAEGLLDEVSKMLTKLMASIGKGKK